MKGRLIYLGETGTSKSKFKTVTAGINYYHKFLLEKYKEDLKIVYIPSNSKSDKDKLTENIELVAVTWVPKFHLLFFKEKM